MIQVSQTYTPEPFKNSFLWLVPEKEVKEIQSVKKVQLEGGSLLMRWRCHGQGQSQREVKEGSWARTRECSLDADSPYPSTKQMTEISVPQLQGCEFCQQEE